MNRLHHYLLVVAFLFMGAAMHGQDKPAASTAETIEQYRALIKETMEKSKLVGVGAALVFGDGQVWKEGFGFADKEQKIPYTSQTTQPIGSGPTLAMVVCAGSSKAGAATRNAASSHSLWPQESQPRIPTTAIIARQPRAMRFARAGGSSLRQSSQTALGASNSIGTT